MLIESILWKNIREDYVPKWYENKHLIGKVIKVKNNINDKWQYKIIKKVNNNGKLEFVDDENNIWNYGEPLNRKEIFRKK